MKETKKTNSRPLIPLGLYGITAENFSNGRSNYEVVTEMIKSGIILFNIGKNINH